MKVSDYVIVKTSRGLELGYVVIAPRQVADTGESEPLRPVVRSLVWRLLDCGLLEHGFARVGCPACRLEFPVAFRCKGRGRGRTGEPPGRRWARCALRGREAAGL